MDGEVKRFVLVEEALSFICSAPLISSPPGAILFVDGHHSHMSLELVQLAREKGVYTSDMLPPSPPHDAHPAAPRC